MQFLALRQLVIEELHHQLLVEELRRRTVLVELTNVLKLREASDGWWLDQEALVVL